MCRRLVGLPMCQSSLWHSSSYGFGVLLGTIRHKAVINGLFGVIAPHFLCQAMGVRGSPQTQLFRAKEAPVAQNRWHGSHHQATCSRESKSIWAGGAADDVGTRCPSLAPIATVLNYPIPSVSARPGAGDCATDCAVTERARCASDLRNRGFA
jgi:hypothetical protein